MGTSSVHHGRISLQEDHPHAYGDKIPLYGDSEIFVGSSPRVWGQVERFQSLDKPLRIIPTRMGTSVWVMVLRFVMMDHPHAYGDKNILKRATI